MARIAGKEVLNTFDVVVTVDHVTFPLLGRTVEAQGPGLFVVLDGHAVHLAVVGRGVRVVGWGPVGEQRVGGAGTGTPLGLLAKADEVHVVVRGVAEELTLGGVVAVGHRGQIRLEEMFSSVSAGKDTASAPDSTHRRPNRCRPWACRRRSCSSGIRRCRGWFPRRHQDVGVGTLGDQGGVQRAGDVAASLLGASTGVLTVGEAVGPPVDEAGGGQGFVVREGQHGTVNLLHLVAVLGGLGVPSRRGEGREEQRDEQPDDRDHNEQLDEGESTRTFHGVGLRRGEQSGWSANQGPNRRKGWNRRLRARCRSGLGSPIGGSPESGEMRTWCSKERYQEMGITRSRPGKIRKNANRL